MKTTTRRKSSIDALAALAALASLASAQASLAQWESEIGADISLIYTDNLGLASKGFEVEDGAILVAPSFKVTNDSERIKADLRYRPEGYFFSDNSDFNDIFHVLDAQITGALVPQALYLFVSAVNYQTILSPEFNFPTTNLPITGNRIDATIWEIKPYWDQDLGFADIYLEVAYADSQYDESRDVSPDFNDNNVQKRGYFSLDNHKDQEGLAWGIDYLTHRFEYEDALPWEYQRAAANLGYWINGDFRIFGRGGKETSYEDFLESNLDDDFWEAGFQYRPNNRLDLEIAIGKRSFGDSKRGSISYRMRRGTTALSYTEEPSSRGQIGYDYRPISAIDNLDGFLDRPGATDRFLRKRGEWSTNIELAKTIIDLRVFLEERSLRTTDDGTPLDDEELGGVAFRWAWKLGPKSTARLIADYAESDYSDPVGRTSSDLIRIGADYEFLFSERFAFVFYVHHARERGDVGSTLDYDENQARVTLRSRF